jgi:hypothetical protein
MRRRGTPTLYELARSTSASDASSRPSSGALEVAMRSIRIPLGFLWLLGVCVLILAVVAYAFGYGRGRSAGFAEGVSQKLEEQAAQASVRTVRDPLRQPAPVTVAAEPAPEPVAAERPAAPAPVPTGGDPRQAGYWYFTLARPSAAAANEMLAFCRAEGLDAHLVSEDNGKSRKIIVLPPLANAEARKTPAGQALEAKIKKAGDRWKAKAKGNRNFSDAYPELFKG